MRVKHSGRVQGELVLGGLADLRLATLLDDVVEQVVPERVALLGEVETHVK
jgi:hypothetical protein